MPNENARPPSSKPRGMYSTAGPTADLTVARNACCSVKPLWRASRRASTSSSHDGDRSSGRRAVGVDGVRCQSSSSRSGSNDASTASRSRVDLSVPPYNECRCRDASSSAARRSRPSSRARAAKSPASWPWV